MIQWKKKYFRCVEDDWVNYLVERVRECLSVCVFLSLRQEKGDPTRQWVAQNKGEFHTDIGWFQEGPHVVAGEGRGGRGRWERRGRITLN